MVFTISYPISGTISGFVSGISGPQISDTISVASEPDIGYDIGFSNIGYDIGYGCFRYRVRYRVIIISDPISGPSIGDIGPDVAYDIDFISGMGFVSISDPVSYTVSVTR